METGNEKRIRYCSGLPIHCAAATAVSDGGTLLSSCEGWRWGWASGGVWDGGKRPSGVHTLQRIACSAMTICLRFMRMKDICVDVSVNNRVIRECA